ncbi:hypothetical protein IV102_23480 [bacterium]|nr:hypothetical protein [bacterium]
MQLNVPFQGAGATQKVDASVTRLGLELLDSQAATVASFMVPVPPGTSNLAVSLVNLPVGALTLRVAGLDRDGNTVGYANLPVYLAGGTTTVTVDTIDTGGYVLDSALIGTDLGNFVGTSNPGSRSGDRPNDFSLACDGLGNLAVASRDASTVTVYSPEGKKLRTFRAQEPAFVQGDASGNFYVNSYAGLLQKFAPDGSLVASTQLPEQITGQSDKSLRWPAPFAVDSSQGLLCVPLALNNNLDQGAGLTFDLSLNRTGHTLNDNLDFDLGLALSATFDSDHRLVVAGASTSPVLARDPRNGWPFWYAALFFDSSLHLEHHVPAGSGYYWEVGDSTGSIPTIGGGCADTTGASYLFFVPAHNLLERGFSSRIYKYNDAMANLTAIIPVSTRSWTASTCAIACDPRGRLYVLTIPYDGQSPWRKTTWTVSRYLPATR